MLELNTSRILILLEIPHFGRIRDVNACIKQLLSCIHGGFMWMDEKVEIIVRLIFWIIGLPIQGENLKILFSKENEKLIV